MTTGGAPASTGLVFICVLICVFSAEVTGGATCPILASGGGADTSSYIYQFTVSEDIANEFIRLGGLLGAPLPSPPPPPPSTPPPAAAAVFKRHILKETLFPD